MPNAKRVLFVERNLRNEKLGVMYLSASLKARGHHADLIQTDKENLDDKIRDYQPDFVAFSITTGEHIYALQIARDLKERFGITNIFGGPHCTFFPELGFAKDVDFIVQGHGEQAIVQIVEGQQQPGFIKAEMAKHLDDHAFPDREIFYQYAEFRDNPMKNVITSRACPYKCSYCFNHSQLALTKIDGETKQWFDRRSIENVVSEIHGIQDRYGVEKILYLDDSFIQTTSWLDAFLDGYTKQVKLPWMCSLRVNCLDETLAKRMFESGLEMVNYAMESADPDVQQRLLHRGHISNGDVIRAISLFDQFGVRARMQNMIGLPLSNPLEDALNTLQFNMRHRVTDSWCSIFQPYPRTALGQYCLDNDFTTADQLRHCSESFFDESRLDISNKSELYALQKLWYFIIDGDLSLDLVQILIGGSFNEKIGDELQRLRFKCSRKKLYGIDDADIDTDVNLQSRERWAIKPEEVDLHNGHVEPLVRAAMIDTRLPNKCIDILSKVKFDAVHLMKFKQLIRGQRVFQNPLYTIDDTTGELADPEVSIYIRGTDDPNEKDIREMPESHFMRDMAQTRDALADQSNGKVIKESAKQLVSLNIMSHEGETVVRGESSDSDERHLNQYLA